MRVCVFSPDVAPLLEPGWRKELGVADGPHHIVLITNSWADRAIGCGVHPTGGTTRAPMKMARRLLGKRPLGGQWIRGLAAEPFVRVVDRELIEGLRAADPDVVVSLHPGWTSLLRRRIRAAGEHWPCVTIGAPLPSSPLQWRRYDPGVKVSIVLPTYNGVRFLGESIRSCLTQSHDNIELIVVDDGSTAPVRDVVAAFSDPRLTFVPLAKNGGLPRALNEGFARIHGDFCTWTSDDNYYALNAIERMLSFLQTYPSVDFVYTSSFRWDEHRARQPWEEPVIHPRPPESLQFDNFIGASFLYSRKVAQTVGPYNAKAVLAEDYDYWLRVHKRFTMQRLLTPLYTYRFHDDSLTSKHAAQIASTVAAVQQAHRLGASA